MSPHPTGFEISVDDEDLFVIQEDAEELAEEPSDEALSEQDSSFFLEDKPMTFLDQRFVEDDELRLSGEQRLKLEIIRSLREPCDRLAYGKKLSEAAKKLGKSDRTVRRLIKAWENAGLAVLEPQDRVDKGQLRKSEYWYNLSVKTYKAGNRGSDRMTRSQTAEAVKVQAYELAKKELKPEIIKLETQGLEGEALDRAIGKLIESREQGQGLQYWEKYGKPPSTRTVERWLKPIEERRHQAKSSRSPGWHGSELVLNTRDGQQIVVKSSNQVWQNIWAVQDSNL